MAAVRACLLFCIALVCAPEFVSAETFRAQLRPRDGTGATGSGSAVLELDNSETQISYSIEYSGLSSSEIGAHIHTADGSIAFALPSGSPKLGVWSNPGNVNVLLLQSNSLYVLIHTEDNPGGELRGDIADDVVATDPATWGRMKSRYGPASD